MKDTGLMPEGTADRAASGAELSAAMARRLTLSAVVANTLGATFVFVFLTFLLPVSINPAGNRALVVRNIVAMAVYVPLGLVIGTRWARRRAAPINQWLLAERPATETERQAVLRQPLGFALVSATFWGIAAVVFSLLNVSAPATFPAGPVTIVLGGISTSALGYLLAERVTRPLTARALEAGPPTRPVTPGVTVRLTMAWLVATGVPVLGVVVVAVAELGGTHHNRAPAASLFLASIALGVGLSAIVAAARSVSHPVGAVRRALARVESGEFDARVAVDDGSEVGLLEAGFNRMAAGLEERERMRDLFGRHVGRDVARAALEGDVALGGEEREIAALFVDLVGSTTLATRRSPTEVVTVLNAFFRIVVDVTEGNGGLVNKFEGDAALCVFGAPVTRPDPAGDALRAGRALRSRLRQELPDVDVGIGVSGGTAVAGNVGAEERFEYTVIGDPVNEAARLCELAKQRPERLLASEAAVTRAAGDEAAAWSVGDAVTLRGRDAPTRLATIAA
jgi:adenylate cyclase